MSHHRAPDPVAPARLSWLQSLEAIDWPDYQRENLTSQGGTPTLCPSPSLRETLPVMHQEWWTSRKYLLTPPTQSRNNFRISSLWYSHPKNQGTHKAFPSQVLLKRTARNKFKYFLRSIKEKTLSELSGSIYFPTIIMVDENQIFKVRKLVFSNSHLLCSNSSFSTLTTT